MQPALNVHGNAQGHAGALLKTFAPGPASAGRYGDVLELRAHLKGQTEAGRQFCNCGAHSPNADQKMIVLPGDLADEVCLFDGSRI